LDGALTALPMGALAILLALCFCGAQIVMQKGWLQTGPANDFLTFYSAAGAADLYAAGGVEAARPEGFAGLESSSRPYLRAPFHAALYAPFRLLPYATAYQVFQILMVWCVAAFVMWWRPPTPVHTVLFTAISVPLFFTFLRGQDLPIVLFAIAACASLVRLEKSFLAGLCLSLAAVYPPALPALPVAILAQRRWAVGAGFVSGLAALAAASFAYAGLDWPQRFAAAWLASEPASAAAMPNLAGAAAWLGIDPLAAVAAALTLAGAVYAVGRRESFSAAIACALAASYLISPRANLEDAVLLLPAALVLLAEMPSWAIRFCAAILLTPIAFILQGGEEPIPALVLLSLLTLLLAGVTPSAESQAAPRGELVSLRLS
jgi:hypothetical protein